MAIEHTPSKDSLYHPALHAPNIKTVISLTLDFEKIPYASWAKLFKIHLQSFDLLFLIDKFDLPSHLTPSLIKQLDAMVLKWIFATISESLLTTILEDSSAAAEAWNRLEELFHNNKESRAVFLEKEFISITMTKYPLLNDYCQKLKSIGDQLKNIGSPVNDDRMVIRLVTGLDPKYNTTAALIVNTSPLPTFARA